MKQLELDEFDRVELSSLWTLNVDSMSDYALHLLKLNAETLLSYIIAEQGARTISGRRK